MEAAWGRWEKSRTFRWVERDETERTKKDKEGTKSHTHRGRGRWGRVREEGTKAVKEEMRDRRRRNDGTQEGRENKG